MLLNRCMLVLTFTVLVACLCSKAADVNLTDDLLGHSEAEKQNTAKMLEMDNDGEDYQDYYDGAEMSDRIQRAIRHHSKPPVFYEPPPPRVEEWTAGWYSIFNEVTRQHDRDCHSHYEYRNFILDPARMGPEAYRERREARREKWKAGGYQDREDDYHRMNIDEAGLFEAMRYISLYDDIHGVVRVPFMKKVLYNSKMSEDELEKRIKAGNFATLRYDKARLRRSEGPM